MFILVFPIFHFAYTLQKCTIVLNIYMQAGTLGSSIFGLLINQA